MMNEASERAIAFLRALGETFLKRIQADNPRFHTALGQKFQIAHPPPGVRRIPSTPEIDRLLVKAADEPDSDLKPQLVDALGSRRLFAGWSRSDLQMLVAFGSYERQADPKNLQKWIARGDLQLILLGPIKPARFPVIGIGCGGDGSAWNNGYATPTQTRNATRSRVAPFFEFPPRAWSECGR